MAKKREIKKDQRSRSGPKTPEGRARSLANLKPAQPGEIRNPKGRTTAGATQREWLNSLAEKDLTEDELRKIARDKTQPWTKRSAAERAIRTLEAGDLADMQAWLDGEADLQQLRKAGVNTEVIKKAKIKKKIVYHDKNTGETTEVEEREIELHDRAGVDFDRVANRTEGNPTQRLLVKDEDAGLRRPADGAAALDSLCAGLAKRLGIAGPG